jgi:hypothetical protein
MRCALCGHDDARVQDSRSRVVETSAVLTDLGRLVAVGLVRCAPVEAGGCGRLGLLQDGPWHRFAALPREFRRKSGLEPLKQALPTIALD